MILLFVIAAWILATSLVAGLCAAARAGDLVQLEHASAPAGWGRVPLPAWESIEHLEIAASAGLRPIRPPESGVPQLHSDGVAA